VANNEEHLIQVALLNWLKHYNSEAYGLIYANCNAGVRTPRHGKYFKDEGLKRLTLAMPRKGFHGLYMEIKTLKGRPTKEQLEWLDKLSNQGYFAVLCKGLDAAIDTITAYLSD